MFLFYSTDGASSARLEVGCTAAKCAPTQVKLAHVSELAMLLTSLRAPCAAGLVGLPCAVVVPRGTAGVKLDAIRSYGAEVVLCEPTTAAR